MPSKQTSGYRHKQAVAQLHRDLVDGTPCWWCGRGLYRSAAMNGDGKTLQADHVTPRIAGNPGPPSRLLHATCNNQRGPGRDHLRPALTGGQPVTPDRDRGSIDVEPHLIPVPW